MAQLAITFFAILPSVAFIFLIVKDSRKFKAKGINTRPYLWGVGMIFPLILIAFPLYLIRRNITWLKERNKIISTSDDVLGLRGWYNRTNSMTKNTKIKINKVVTILKWTVVVLIGLFGLGVIFQIPWYIEKQKTDEQVAKIHATKLTMDDVMGVNLPPDPGVEADKTVAGIDANKNGIRDDVELAIFKEYPNSAKTRAVLLQYALALQMEVTQPFLDTKNVVAAMQEGDRAHLCIGEIFSREDMNKFIKKVNALGLFVKEKQINTQERRQVEDDFYKKIGSYSSLSRICDIDYSVLPN
ncbi:MAG: hypothetical protein HY939_07270 [Gammaproteobacteria bacterium]|nr:hypothetical protein [Gammaproteobacteria bacterium]